MKITDEMAEIAARILNKRLAEGNGLHGVSREMLEAALTAAPASAAHSNKLRSSLENVAESLSSRPRELRGPFDSGATATEIASLRRELAELREDKRIVDELLDAAITDYNEARAKALEDAATLLDEGFDRGIKSKHDTCEHGKFEWEDCELCAATAIRNLAGEKADG